MYEIYSHINISATAVLFFIFVIEKERKTKKRMKEEEIEIGDCGPPNRKGEKLLAEMFSTCDFPSGETLPSKVPGLSEIVSGNHI